jgi:hypothetical protein
MADRSFVDQLRHDKFLKNTLIQMKKIPANAEFFCDFDSMLQPHSKRCFEAFLHEDSKTDLTILLPS